MAIVASGPDAAASLAGMLPDAATATAFVPDPYGQGPDATGPALEPFLRDADVILTDSSQPSRDLAGWASVTLEAPVVWAVDRIEPGPPLRLQRITLGGTHRLVHEIDGSGPVVVLARPSGVRPREVDVRRVRVGPSRTRVVRTSTDGTAGVPLPAARIVVGVGRGIGGPDALPLYRRLADELGAALGASRVVVDAGWLPFAHQVGQTGAVIAPDLYLAFGISGAIQHLAGIRASKRVVAVNTDPDAPLCRLADVVVNADAGEVARALLDRIGR